MNRKKEKRKIKSIKLIIVLLLAIGLMPVFYSGARFVYKAIYEHYVSTKDFSFKSNKLNEEHSEFLETNNWNGTQTYRLIVNMSSKKNDMAYTSSDVAYTISLTSSDNITCTLSKNSGIIRGSGHGNGNGNVIGNVVGNEIINGTISEAVNEDYFIVYVNPAQGTSLGSGQRAWVDITATSTSPYEKEIYGKIFIETGSASVSYEIVDSVNSPYLTLNITNASTSAKNITLSYDPTLLLIDMTNPFVINKTSETTQQINNNAYINTITSSMQANYNISIKFYKENRSQNYTYLGTGTPIITLTHN